MADQHTAYLVPIAGPSMPPLVLTPQKAGVSIGRSDQCELPLPLQHAQQVSRVHARLRSEAGEWRLADMDSRWGTYLNGTRLATRTEVRLNEGDLIRLAPWTFMFTLQPKRDGVCASDDIGQTVVRTFSAETVARHLPEETLALLMESTASMHAANDEKQLAELVMDASLRGTGLANAVMLRPIDAGGQLQIIASKTSARAENQVPTFSRSLINAALLGQVAEMSGADQRDWSQSIVQMQISQALCIPLMLAGAPAAVLYLDRRGGSTSALLPGATAFCVALGRMASLALSNLKRVEIERRQARMEAELRAASMAQKWILPERRTVLHGLTILGESRAGQYVGGDFFDVIDLGNDRVAIALGDVAGHGVAASVLMTSTQGFLHATLLSDPDPGQAATAVNRFVYPRRDGSTFVTLWLGVFDLGKRQLAYVDAGHGYALLQAADGNFTSLDRGDGLPIGADQTAVYQFETVDLANSNQVVVVSDGIIEQSSGERESPPASQNEFFGLQRVREVLSSTDGALDPIASVFEAVVGYAGTNRLSDDATAVMVRW